MPEDAKKSRADSPAPGAKGAAPGPEKRSDADRALAIERLKAGRLVIPEEGLKRIAEHKYVPGVYTPLDNIFNKFVWTPLIGAFPTWLAPNTITVAGLVIQMIGYCVLAFYCSDFRAAAPRWVYVFIAFTVFAYQTLDALDGKQARRTGSSSPLGQLFDHGCDSVVTIFIGMITAMCLHLGFSVRCVTFTMYTLLPFWMCQWTEYHAHVLFTSIGGIVGVTEAQLMSMAIALVNVVDIGFWNRDLGTGVSLPSWWCGQEVCPLALNDCCVFAQILLGAAGCASCLGAVLPAVREKGTTGEALLQTLPSLMLALVGYAWCILIPQGHTHPRLVLFTLGVSFSHMTCKMIVAAMSHTEYSLFQPALIPLPVIFVISFLRLLPRHDDILLGVYAAISVYSMGMWVKSAIEEISVYIGIHTFRLGPREKPKDI